MYDGKAMVPCTKARSREPGFQHSRRCDRVNAKLNPGDRGQRASQQPDSEYLFSTQRHRGAHPSSAASHAGEPLIREVEIVPLEVVVRTVAAGSL